jgi:hypothetical protein
MTIKQASVILVGVVVYAEFWDTHSQNVEKKHSLIMAMIQVVNPIPWKMKKKKIILLMKMT